MSIRSRIFLGFAALLALLVIVAWIAGSGIAAINSKVKAVPAASAAALFAERTVEGLVRLQWRIAAYTMSERGADLDNLKAEQSSFANLLFTEAQIGAVGGHPGFTEVKQDAARLFDNVGVTIKLMLARSISLNALKATGIGLSNAASALTSYLVRNQQLEQLAAAIQLQESLQSGFIAATRFVASRNPADADNATVELDRVATLLLTLRQTLLDQPRPQRYLSNIEGKLPAYGDAIRDLLSNLSALDSAFKRRGEISDALAAQTEADRGSFVAAERADVADSLQRIQSVQVDTIWTVVAALIVGLVATWMLGRSVTKPLRALVLTMRRLANGEHGLEVGNRHLGDEIGEMARAVEVFRLGAIERLRLQQDQEAADALAARERRRVVEEVATAFENQVRDVVEVVAGRAGEMLVASQLLSTSATATNRKALAVAERSVEACANVEAVADAAEELATTIVEVSRQIGRAADAARQASAESLQTDATFNELAEAVGRIGSMTDLIRTIAGQSHLLALNATIEAARAGKAGAGFAVVAGEVKNLAQQAAQAAETISSQITAIQQSTTCMVQAIALMSQTTAVVDAIAETVAVSIRQQSKATAEITRNAHTAASGTREISATVASVGESSGATGGAAAQMLGASHALGNEAETLRSTAANFLVRVRAAA